MQIFVGNLAFAADQNDVKKLFEGFGKVASAVIVMNREKKEPKSRGFAFVEMLDDGEARNAIAALNGKEFMGRALEIAQARPKAEVVRRSEFKRRPQLRARPRTGVSFRKKPEPPKVMARPTLNPLGTYKSGKQTRRYVGQRSLGGIPAGVKPERKGRDNPVPWQKKKIPSKPWERPAEKSKKTKKVRPRY